MTLSRRFWLAVAIVCPAASGVAAPVDGAALYEKDVQPILKAHCLSCHGGEAKIKGGLNLATRDGLLKGGDTGPAVTVDKPADSLMLKALHGRDDVAQMPPKGKLPQAQIDTLTAWVMAGVPYSAPKIAAATHHGPPAVTAEAKQFWAFRVPTKPAVPAGNGSAIDAFIGAKLVAKGLTPAGPADKLALLRRVTFDLTGLPPTPAEVAAFAADPSPDAYAKVVDRLLASPRYGEQQARRWMDVVRYGETNSYERDGPKPHVWRYRDYLIQSFNADKPYDRFLREQLAGDELFPGDADALIATGYYRLGLWDDEPADPLQAKYDDLDDIVTTTGQGLLGLTLNCARCHDHKLDPVPQADYYRLLAFFQKVRRYGIRDHNSVVDASVAPIDLALAPEEVAEHTRQANDHARKFKKVDEAIGALESKVYPDLTPVEKEEWVHPQTRRDIVKKRVPKIVAPDKFATYEKQLKERDLLTKNAPKAVAKALCVKEAVGKPIKTTVLMRGNPHVEGAEVQPGFPQVLSPPEAKVTAPAGGQSSGRRSALAAWVADAKNPLTARVMVNRVWQAYFGRGIVRSSNNFGFQGTPPTHPELLDYLASEFMAGGWKLKPLTRQIVLSAAYRRASTGDGKNLAADPENDLFWRHDMRRLQAEEIRDGLLATTGTLNPKMGGPSVYPLIEAEVLAGQSRPGEGWPTSSPTEGNRRSVYVHVKRSLPLPILATYDAADTDTSCPVRFASTTPTQALTTLNGRLLNEHAKALADAVSKEPAPARQVAAAYERATQRAVRADEVQRGVAFLQKVRDERGLDDRKALELLCLMVLNLNEVIYLD